MPNLTVTPEAPLELIRQHPALAAELMRALTGLTVPGQADIRLGPNDLNTVVPAEPAVADRVLEAIRDTGASDADQRKLVTIIMKRAIGAARQILENMVTMIEWQDEWLESYFQKGMADGMAQGEARGEAKGAVSAKITNIMKVLSVRDLHPTKKQLSQLAACTDLATLDRWFDRSLIAASAAEVFKD
jgi:hypothetical protein